MGTYLEVLRCPDCGVPVRETVRHGLFQAGGTSIGPAAIPCPQCGLLLESGQSEWEEKSTIARWWFFLQLVLWAVVGACLAGSIVGVCGSWLLAELNLLPRTRMTLCALVVTCVVAGVVVWLLFRNALQDVRASQERTRHSNQIPSERET
jgi:hypothetical protein